MAERSAVEWAEAVRDAERRGELLTAFDLAERALEEHPDDLWLRHRAVLALARAGSTDQAARRFREYGLTDVETEDVAALRARIVKDIALGGEGAERRQAATRSAELYAAIHARTGGWYPAVNAATLSLVAAIQTARASSPRPPSTRWRATETGRTTQRPQRPRPSSCSAGPRPRAMRSRAPWSATKTTTAP